MTVYYFKEDCRNVTEYYYNIILDALKMRGVECKVLDKCVFKTARTISKNDYVLVTTLKSFIILYLLGRKNYIYWYQGITPEENYMMFKSKWRYNIYSYLEKLSLKVVKHKIGVSKYLFEHFEQKYQISIKANDVFVMPCFNSNLNKKSFYTPNKYTNNIFCYAGGIQVWQGFDAILRIYGEIERKHDDVFLKIYSKDVEAAKKAIEDAHLKNYMVDCVPQSEIDKALADCKFGFIIREDDIINNVATPTKLATYIGNGVIPIFTSTIKSYSDLAKQYRYLCCVNEDDVISKIEKIITTPIVPEDLLSEYSQLFDDYYNREKYIQKLQLYLNNV